jgi:hypothetical protein
MNNIIQTIRHAARAATVLLIALLAAQTAGAEEYIREVSDAYDLEDAFGNTNVSVVNVTDNITDVGGLNLNHNLTINLNGHTISGDELYFKVDSDGSLTINGGGQGGSVGNIISGYADTIHIAFCKGLGELCLTVHPIPMVSLTQFFATRINILFKSCFSIHHFHQSDIRQLLRSFVIYLNRHYIMLAIGYG